MIRGLESTPWIIGLFIGFVLFILVTKYGDFLGYWWDVWVQMWAQLIRGGKARKEKDEIKLFSQLDTKGTVELYYTLFTYFGGFIIMGFGFIDLISNLLIFGLVKITFGFLAVVVPFKWILKIPDLIRKRRRIVLVD